MSGVEKPNLFQFRNPRAEQAMQELKKTQEGRKVPQENWTQEERRWALAGAMKASLLIGLAYIVGLGLLILIMWLLWRS